MTISRDTVNSTQRAACPWISKKGPCLIAHRKEKQEQRNTPLKRRSGQSIPPRGAATPAAATPIRAAFMKLFTTSPSGLGIRSGADARDRKVGSKSPTGLLKDCDSPTRDVLCSWVTSDIRDYNTRIIDSEWDQLDQPVYPTGLLNWRDIDNKKLEFRSKARPAARYLYFHYYLQVLRRAWKAGASQAAALQLRDELGKPFWGTPGRYIGKKVLRAFIEELGHEADELLIGASITRGGDKDLMVNAAVSQIVETAGAEDYETSEDESSDEDLDLDDE